MAAGLLAALLSAAVPAHDAAWAAALGPGQVHLPAGHYQGPWRIGAGVHLVAAPGAVLEGGDPALALAGDGASVAGLTVRGPGVGVAAKGVHRVRLEKLTVRAGTQGFYLAEGDAVVERSSFEGGEYGLLTWNAGLQARGDTFAKVRRAGIGLVRSRGRVEDCAFRGPFGEAAISIVGSQPVELARNRVREAGAVGVKFVNSSGTLEENSIEGARSDARGLEGDDLYLFDSEVTGRGDVLLGGQGTGLTVLSGRAAFAGCRVEGAGQAAVYVGENGRLTLSGCRVTDAPVGLFVEPGSTADTPGTGFARVGNPDGGAGMDGGPR